MNAEMFGKRLLECVDKIGGVGKACEAAGITYTTLTRWKDGTSDPKMSNIIAFAKAAGVSLDWLMTGEGDSTVQAPVIDPVTGVSVEQAIDTLKNLIEDNQPKLTEDEAFLLKEFRALAPDQQRLMLRFLVAGFDGLNNGNNSNNHNTYGNNNNNTHSNNDYSKSNHKGVFNSPNTKITGSFTG